MIRGVPHSFSLRDGGRERRTAHRSFGRKGGCLRATTTGKSCDAYHAAISQTEPGFLGVASGAGFGLLNLDLDLGNNGKSLGCLYWGLHGAVRQADEYWSELALRAVSEERSELRKGD